MSSLLLSVLVVHEWWITLQHVNIWLNPWVQKLDRTYGLALVHQNQHPVITLVLGEYWIREIITMVLCSWWIQSSGLQTLVMFNLVYHVAKVSSIVHDGFTKSSSLYGILYSLLSPFKRTSRQETIRSVVRLGTQGMDTIVHASVAYTLASTHVGWWLPGLTTAAWLWHQATVYWTGRSTATRPVERARQVCVPSDNPHSPAFTVDGDTMRLLRPLDADTPVHTVILGHPLTVASSLAFLYTSTWEPFVPPSSGWRRAAFCVIWGAAAIQSVVVHLFWTQPLVCDRFQTTEGAWVETWLVPSFGYQYALFPRTCERKVTRCLQIARQRGARRVILGAMNKAVTIGNSGEDFSHLFDPLEMQVDDGNLLTAAVLNYHVQAHLGSATRFRLVGATSKIGTAIAQYWSSRGVVVECVSSSHARLRLLSNDTGTPLVLLGPGDVGPMAPPVLWVFCRGGHYDVHPESIVLTVALPAPTFHRRPRRVIDAGRVVYANGQSPFHWHLGLDKGEMYPCLATGTIPSIDAAEPRHVLGPIDHRRLDEALDHAHRHGLRPLEYDHELVIVGTGIAGLLVAHACKPVHPLVLGGDTNVGGRWLQVSPTQELTSLPHHLHLPGLLSTTHQQPWTSANVLAYIHRNLRPEHLVLGDPVTSISTYEGTFRLTTQKGQRYSARNIILALGTGTPLGIPANHPRIDASCVTTPPRWDNLPTARRVLLLGMGHTAIDLYMALRANRCEVRFCVRSCPVILPHHNILGLFDIESLVALYERLPRGNLRGNLLALLSWVHGTSIREWIPSLCPSKAYRSSSGPLVDRSGFVSLVQSGHVQVYPPIIELARGPDSIRGCFLDGTHWDPEDVFVCYGRSTATTLETADAGVLVSSRCVDMQVCGTAPLPIQAMAKMASALGRQFGR
jgi:hypothetical protein